MKSAFNSKMKLLKMKNILSYLLFACLTIGLASCGPEPENDNILHIESDGDGKLSIDINTDADNIEQAAEDLGNKISNAVNNIDIDFKDEDGEKVEVVNFRELKKLLPDEIGGAERTDAKGQKSGMFGINVATAEGKYRNGDKRADVTIVDIGGMGLAVMQYAQWSKFEIDNESDDGYERTTEIDGHKALVKWNSKSQRGEINVLVNDRFVVSIKGRNMDMDDLEDALDDIDLDDLEDLG